jgi:hypothetical protein
MGLTTCERAFGARITLLRFSPRTTVCGGASGSSGVGTDARDQLLLCHGGEVLRSRTEYMMSVGAWHFS